MLMANMKNGKSMPTLHTFTGGFRKKRGKMEAFTTFAISGGDFTNSPANMVK